MPTRRLAHCASATGCDAAMNENLTRDLARQPMPSLADVWAPRLGALVVAGVAAYASYQHQLGFALAGGADLTTARVWPLSVDGLLVLSTTGLLREGRRTSARARYTELDKIARTNNYGRAVLRMWQRRGRTHSPAAPNAS